MKKQQTSTPGIVLKEQFLEKYNINVSQLARSIGLSQSAVRNITIDKAKMTIPIALRLAKFFQTKENYFINLQADYDILALHSDKTFSAKLNKIGIARKAEKKAAKTGAKAKAPRSAGNRAAAGKPAPKGGRRRTAKK
jgi:addiction module HigA family antidote